MNDFYDTPTPEQTTIDRLVRIMDEERSLHIDASKRFNFLKDDISRWELANRDLRTENFELRERNRQLSEAQREFQAVRLGIFGRSDLEQLATVVNRIIDQDRGSFEQPVVNKIPTIKAVREKYGVGLKFAKDVVDRWVLADIDQENAADEFNRQDAGTFDEESIEHNGPSEDNPFLQDYPENPNQGELNARTDGPA